MVLLWIIFFNNKRRIIKTIDSWLQKRCWEDTSHLFSATQTFWTFKKGICKGLHAHFVGKESGIQCNTQVRLRMQLKFHWQACSSKLYPWWCFFSFFFPPFLTALWLIMLLDPFPFWKGLQLQGSDYNWPWLTLSLHHCVPSAIIIYI